MISLSHSNHALPVNFLGNSAQKQSNNALFSGQDSVQFGNLDKLLNRKSPNPYTDKDLFYKNKIMPFFEKPFPEGEKDSELTNYDIGVALKQYYSIESARAIKVDREPRVFVHGFLEGYFKSADQEAASKVINEFDSLNLIRIKNINAPYIVYESSDILDEFLEKYENSYEIG